MNTDVRPLLGPTSTPAPASETDEEIARCPQEITNNANNRNGEAKRWFVLEPAIFLLFFSMNIEGAVFLNQMLYHTCVNVLHHNVSVCEPFLGIKEQTDEARAIETEVQLYVADIVMARSIFSSVLPAIISLFVGPYSDKYGRRPLLLANYIGYFGSAVLTTILTFVCSVTNLTPWVFVISSTPAVLSGGICTLITASYCYISDLFTERDRAMRMILNEAALIGGALLGNMSSSYIYAATNVVSVFVISSSLALMAVLYVAAFAKESLQPEQSETGSRFLDIFNIDLVKDLVRTCFKRRNSYDRAIVWLSMSTLIITLFIMYGDGNVNYLFLRKKFEWTVKDYSLYNTASNAMQVLGTLVAMLLLKKTFQLSAPSMSLIAIGSSVLENTVRSTAVYSWEMYLGMSLGFLGGVLGPSIRSMLSEIVPNSEIGKIFALTTSLESITPLIAGPIYTTVYDFSVDFYPGFYNFINVALFMSAFILQAIIYGIQISLGSNTGNYAEAKRNS